MTALSDVAIRGYLDSGRLVVDPCRPEMVGPASIDVTLGTTLLRMAPCGVVDPMMADTAAYVPMPAEPSISNRDDPVWWLFPGQMYLGHTAEHISVPDDLVCHVHGRSTLGRYGIVVHQTAGLVDPGFRGHLTLELSVVAPTILRPGMPIAQVTFARLTPASTGYRGRYQDSIGAVPPAPFARAVAP